VRPCKPGVESVSCETACAERMCALSLTALVHSLDIGNGVSVVSAEHLLLPIGQEFLSFGLIHAIHVLFVGPQVLIHNDLLVEIWLLVVLHLHCLLILVSAVVSVFFSLAAPLSCVDIAKALSGVHKDLLLVAHLSVLLFMACIPFFFFLVLNLELFLAHCIQVLDAFDDLLATLTVVNLFTALARVPRASILTIVDDFDLI